MKRLTQLLLISAVLLAVIPLATTNAVAAEKIFVKAKQVAELATSNAPKLRVIDCRPTKAEYDKGHVPGAIYFSVDNDLRGAGPWGTVGVRKSIDALEDLFGRTLGIDNDTQVVLYDSAEDYATLLFWTLKYAGHDKVAIMFGGWPEWTKNKLAVEKKASSAAPALFVGEVQSQLLATSSYVVSKLGNPNTVLVDARPVTHFKAPEKFSQAKNAGRIPGAVSAFTMANWEHKTYLKSPAELEEKFMELGVTPEKEVIVYCNTGWNAANTFFVLKALGYPNVRVYDYSWSEWNAKDYLPRVAVSP